LRTKPGRGDPTESLTCSDKLARWNVLGPSSADARSRSESALWWSPPRWFCHRRSALQGSKAPCWRGWWAPSTLRPSAWASALTRRPWNALCMDVWLPRTAATGKVHL